jgi:hypothetical protein
MSSPFSIRLDRDRFVRKSNKALRTCRAFTYILIGFGGAERTWSPTAGIPVRLKVEDAGDPTHSVETEAVTTVAGGWETLVFNFANEATGTAALNPGYTFNKVSIFFNFGTTGVDGGGGTFYYDDIAMLP